MHEHHFTTQKTVRFYTNTQDFSETEFVWIALHGYGQLAKYFARNFLSLNAQKHLVVVPEAQSRFYLDGVYGRVGATWMTKEDRETDILDYVKYLDDLKSTISAKFNWPVKWVVLGFSQGAATACRWIDMGNAAADHLVLWSSVFQHDLKTDGFLKAKTLKTWLLMGDTDEYMNDERWKENAEIMKTMAIEAIKINFVGGHKIYPKVLDELVYQIEKA